MHDAEGRTYTIRAGGIERRSGRWELLPPAPGREIEVERYNAPAPGRAVDTASGTRFTAKTAGLISPLPDQGDPSDLPTLTLVMEISSGLAIGSTRSAESGGSDGAGVLTERKFPNMSLSDSFASDLMKLSSRELLAEANRSGLTGDPVVASGAADLSERLENLNRNVISKQHERVADSAACLVMVICGAVTALRLGSSLPLTVYLWSFFPALLAIITISTGQQTTRHLGLQGLAILWGGVALLAAYAAGAYWIARRH
jgi:hypothetical protein